MVNNYIVLRLNLKEIEYNMDYLEFMQLLQWKDGQNLVYYMLDDYDFQSANNEPKSTLIAPFWSYLSTQLTNLHDPVTNKKYSALHLNAGYYERTDVKYKCDVKVSSVLAELYFVTMKFKTIKEILYQSNETLNIVQFYGQSANKFIKCKLSTNMTFIETESSIDDDIDEWHISSDYLSEL